MDEMLQIQAGALASEHRVRFLQALNSLLSTDVAERTFAQIIDGLPTRDEVGYFPTYNRQIKNNTSPSPEAIDAAKQFCSQIDGANIELDAKKAQLFQNSALGSLQFDMRLLEILAIACHKIAAVLFESMQPGIHPEVQDPEERIANLGPRPTNFLHEEYTFWQQYPRGVADCVGYWAEYYLFGGVVLLDRGASGNECNGAFLHPVGGFKIFELSESQLRQVSQHAQQYRETNDSLSPYPFKAEKYAYRFDPYDTMALNIYRDRYERIIPDQRPRNCVRRAADEPQLQDQLAEILKARDERERAHEGYEVPQEHFDYVDFLLNPANDDKPRPPKPFGPEV